jgi:ribonuclease HII
MNIKKFNKIVGFTPNYIGYEPGKFVPINKDIIDVVKNKLMNSKTLSNSFRNTLFSSICEVREVYSGSPGTNIIHLKNFTDENNINTSINLDNIIKICLKSDWFKFPKINIKDLSTLEYSTNYNPKSSPGIFTSKLLKSTKKSNTINPAIVCAKELYTRLITKPQRNYALWELLAREKDNKVGYSSKDFSTRVVMNPEHHVSILLSFIFQQIQVASEKSNKKNLFLLDSEFDGDKGVKILEGIINQSDYVVDADWTLFDSSQDKDYLLAACSMLLINSVEDRKDYRFLYWIVSTLITKYVAIPPGIVVELNRGLPSGHPGVTIINCVVNLIRWSIIGYEIYGDNYCDNIRITVYGDDALIGFKDNPKLKNIDQICEKYGFKGDKIYERLYPTYLYYNSEFEVPDFLKRRITLNGIVWNEKKVLDRILFPTRKRSKIETLELLNNYIITANSKTELVKFILMLRRRIFDKKFLYENKDNLKLKLKNEHFTPYICNNKLSGYNLEMSLIINNFCTLKENFKNKDNCYVMKEIDLKAVLYFCINQQLLREQNKEQRIKIFNDRSNFKYFDNYLVSKCASYWPGVVLNSVTINTS